MKACTHAETWTTFLYIFSTCHFKKRKSRHWTLKNVKKRIQELRVKHTSSVPLSDASSQRGNWNGRISNVGRGKTGGYLAPLHSTALQQQHCNISLLYIVHQNISDAKSLCSHTIYDQTKWKHCRCAASWTYNIKVAINTILQKTTDLSCCGFSRSPTTHIVSSLPLH